MKATIADRPQVYNYDVARKPFAKEYSAAVLTDDGKIRFPVTLKIYETDVLVYCLFQAFSMTQSHVGSARVGGYGYHKASAAAHNAIKCSSIDLDESISGVGESAIRDAVEAVARALYPEAKNITVHVAHA